MVAKDIRAFRTLSKNLVKIEERSILLGNLIARGVGLREEEEFLLLEQSKFKSNQQFRKKKEIVILAMKEKLWDNRKFEVKTRKLRNRTLSRIEEHLGRNSRPCRRLRNDVRIHCQNVRREIKKKNLKKEAFLVKKYGKKPAILQDLVEEDRLKYGSAKVFSEEYVVEEMIREEPIIVCMEGEEILISENEAALLALGPKFCVINNLCEETFEVELESCIMKYKWESMGEEENNKKNKSKSDIAFEVLVQETYDEEEKAELWEDEQALEAELRMVFNPDDNKLDLGRRRATDCKGNSRVHFPKKSGNFEIEAKLQTLRTEAMEEFRSFLAKNCQKGGKQNSNLTKSQELGLKSLKKRVKEGEIVVLPTDKSGNFAVMSRRTYEVAGLKHVSEDEVVGWDVIKEAQKEINGHVAMAIKMFGIGRNWGHTDRIRETMLGETLAICPVSLLFKDHKNWTKESGGVPPTRHVAGGHKGMNLHLSEIISDILEPLVETLGGDEVISTEDLLAQVDILNTRNRGWHPGLWWEGKTGGKFQACGRCRGEDDYEFDLDNPELCGCGRVDGTEDGMIRATYNFVELVRRKEWENRMGGQELNYEAREWEVHEVLPEMVQDFTCPMVLIGSDVVSLYPNLDITRVAKMMKEAIGISTMKFEGIDLLECSRYVALNWTREECRSSSLRRILPQRRYTRGTRPGMKGAGPRGGTRGDCEQWIFPCVKLEEWEIRELVGTVVEIMVTALFKKHFYSFGGEKYCQTKGGPIGLRATCAVARVAMQLFDINWRRRLDGILVSLLARYMDDARALLHPIKCGWRYETRGIVFRQEWVGEDEKLTPTERTKKFLASTMEGVEAFLKFTYETCDDFDGWLPTLDMCMRVSENNIVEYNYYEKPTSSVRTVQMNTAMNENSKMQIISNDMVRRLKNTMEELGAPFKGAIVDQYAKKLLRSGYSLEQTRKVLKNGIKGYENRRRSRLSKGLPLRSTGKMSRGSRYRKKLVSKTNWYRKSSKKEQPVGSSYAKESRKGSSEKPQSKENNHPTPKTVLFVEHSRGGELATRMKELVRRLAPILGFSIKVVERTGTALKNSFPLNNLWDGVMCGRPECIPCTQGADQLPPCTQPSLVYENVCNICNKGAANKKEDPPFRTDIPTLYVGETGRSLFERTNEHWGAWRSNKEDSHILRHQINAHGASREPSFTMRAVKFHKTALYRQLGEAVRIRRRGGQGSILNSKAEYDRCYIPRLVVEERNDKEAEQEEQQDQEQLQKILEEEYEEWSKDKINQRVRRDLEETRSIGMIGSRSKGEKRELEKGDKKSRRSKKLKHQIIGEEWGRELPINNREPSMPTTGEQPGDWEPTLHREQPVDAAPEPWEPSTTTRESPEEQFAMLSPKEQRPRRSRQRRMTDFTVAPEEVPPELAGMSTQVSSSGEAFQGSFFEEIHEVGTNGDVGVSSMRGGPGNNDSITRISQGDEMDGYHQEETDIVTPSMSKTEKVVSTSMGDGCNIMKNGMCEQHQKMSFKYQVTSKVWRDRGGGRGYGFVSRKVTKRICRAGKDLPTESNNSTNTRDMSNMANKRIKVRVNFDGGLASGELVKHFENENKERGK